MAEFPPIQAEWDLDHLLVEAVNRLPWRGSVDDELHTQATILHAQLSQKPELVKPARDRLEIYDAGAHSHFAQMAQRLLRAALKDLPEETCQTIAA